MDILNLIGQYGGWSWLVAGFVLLGLELVVPGGILVWMGAAAIVTGLVHFLFPGLGWPVEVLIFGVLSLVSIVAWLRFRPQGEATDRPFLNRRADRFIGQEVVLNEPIRDGAGRVSLGDTMWRVQGPDLAAGAKVRIIGADGALLKVEAA
ncbi:MAG: NfeD family protein [Devosia sp.]|uniref:NfeD family protein n=1 Tax=Devosia sp. TaxID=1871048 RepID=UPI0037C0B771